MFTLASEETYSDGQIIFSEGSSGDWVYVIISGSVEISKMINGKKFILEILKEGEVFGEISFIGGVKRTATVTSVGESLIGTIDRDSMDQEFNKLSSDFRSILVSMVQRFKTMIDRVSDFSARREPRIPKTLSISYKDKSTFLKAYTGNISNGGLFIKTNSPLPKGEMFFLKLQLPDISGPLKIKCTVAWTNKQEEGKNNQPLGMGIQFMEFNKGDDQVLKKYITSIT